MSNEGRKDDKGKAPVSLLPGDALLEIAKVMDFGKVKYSSHNWRLGIVWSRVLDANLRHLLAFQEGQDIDPESGLPHLAHAACCNLFLLEFFLKERYKNLDDRYKEPVSPVKETVLDLDSGMTKGYPFSDD